MKKLFMISLIMLAAGLLFLATDCKKDELSGIHASCVTLAATNVLTRCATLNATVTNNDPVSATIVFEYGTSTGYGSIANPSSHTLTAGTANTFADISGLNVDTKYHFRVKTVNINGVVYGDDMSFSTTTAPVDYTGENGTVVDSDGNVYKTIGIGSQIWMAENLKTTKYRNGDPIETTILSTLDISGEVNPVYQWAYDGEESYAGVYGRLYSWYAAADSRGVCPEGWHVPSDGEWTVLTDYLLGNCYGYVGNGRSNIARAMVVPDWYLAYSVCPGGNKSGFTALPAGHRENDDSMFYGMDSECYWWSSTAYSTAEAIYRSISSTCSSVYSYRHNMHSGFSVRCLKDN